MAVSLEFYRVEESSGVKTLIGDTMDIGSLFKGADHYIPIAVFNSGDEPAISPKVSVVEFFQDGRDYNEAMQWKSLSLDRHANFLKTINLPDIQPESWMQGKEIYFEDFSSYSTAAGTRPDQSWMLWAGNEFVWEVYNGWLQHNVDTQHSRAMWGVLPDVTDFEFSTKITVRNGIYAGYLLRDIGDYDTGYIVLVQGQAQYYDVGTPQNEGVIQVWKGKFSLGIGSWQMLYQSGTIGVRGTHDFFKVKLHGNRFDFWYNNEYSVNPIYTFIDEENTYTGASKPILVSHPGSGSILVYYDDIRLERPTNDGRIWIRNNINKDTPLFGTQLSILRVDYGGE